MAKQSLKKSKDQEQEYAKVLPQKPASIAIKQAFGGNVQPIIETGTLSQLSRQTWEGLQEVSDAIGMSIAQMAEDIHSTVEMVKNAGCEHPAEFNAIVSKTNEDFQKFVADFQSITIRHYGRTGYIESPDDLALSLSIFEDYQQFRAFFDGVMHHSLISFTEYALEAKDRLLDKMKQEEAEAAKAATEAVALSVSNPNTVA